MGDSENKLSVLDTMVWVAIVVLVGSLVWVVYSNSIYARVPYQRPACINYLRQIDAAKQEWALENGKTNGTVCNENDIKRFIKLDSNGNLPKCPQGGIYTIGKVGEPVTCSLGKTNPNHVLP